MAYDQGLAQRLRELLAEQAELSEKNMFGGLAFMLSGNMFCGVVNDTLVARVGPERYAKALKIRNARPMDFTGKPLKGFVYVDPAGYESDQQLQEWVELCLAFVRTLPAKQGVKQDSADSAPAG
ncbi:TfoX/Sxy family protein [Marinobacterium arenosum]|uniref:TfoX/Sxy family protein n=1 Tax=Marinobacterium arenosum TaxID=2862496 RepID=UPI001C988510|nr:TfoX/Sxy family protein [Marinobacterium arenosum]MBY4676646.1 TfoX/Sxy family protein [Marinobacterium arenosum]